MTLDEAITMFEFNARYFRSHVEIAPNDTYENMVIENARHSEQVAEWLRELKAYKGKYHKYYKPKIINEEVWRIWLKYLQQTVMGKLNLLKMN